MNVKYMIAALSLVALGLTAGVASAGSGGSTSTESCFGREACDTLKANCKGRNQEYFEKENVNNGGICITTKPPRK